MQGEEPDLPIPESTTSGANVVGAYDDVDDQRVFVLADVTRDEAWALTPTSDALGLDAWR